MTLTALLNHGAFVIDPTILFAIISGYILFYTLSYAIVPRTASFWGSRPSVGWQKQWFSDVRATWRSMTQSQLMIADGYIKYSKSSIFFAIPSIASGTSIIVPPSWIKDVFSKPDSELSAIEAQREAIQAPYTITDKDIYMNEFHLEIVRKQLTKTNPHLTRIIAEELALAFERYWGTSSEWVSVKALDSVMSIVTQAVNRSFIGLPICREEQFLEHSIKYSESVFGGGIIINIAPAFLRRVIGPLIGLVAKKHLAVCKRICAPIVEERLRHEERKRTEPDFEWEHPEDVLQWVIEACYRTQDPKQLETDRVTHRLLMFNLVATHAISLTTTEVILDLYSSNPSRGFVDGLLEECDQLLAQPSGEWKKDALLKSYRLDSTIRESLRFSNFGVTALSRRIADPEGILLNGNIHIPAGVRLCAPMHEIHHDSAFYPDPLSFNAFRFSQLPKANINDFKTTTVPTHQSATTGDDTFLAFGFGKHMCPGRFFAVNEMKLMLAIMIKNYDIQYMAERPPRQSAMENMVPFKSTTIMVRRKAR